MKRILHPAAVGIRRAKARLCVATIKSRSGSPARGDTHPVADRPRPRALPPSGGFPIIDLHWRLQNQQNKPSDTDVLNGQDRMNILVVEADPKIREQLLSALSESLPKAEVQSYDPVASGRPAADFKWSKFDVLLLDFFLGPEDNGLDWLRTYKKESSRFPATVMLTSADDEEVAIKALRHGAHDFIRKGSLSAPRLAESIADALNLRYRESSAESSLTINASKFSKSFFYGQLDFAFEEAEKNQTRALLFIRVDGYEELRRSLGVLAMEDVTRHLANAGIEVFNFGTYRSRATRFSDASIGILVGGYKDEDDLERLLQQLCDRVSEEPPKIKAAPVPVTMSIGVAIITTRSMGIDNLFELAEKAATKAGSEAGNSFAVLRPDRTDEPVRQASVPSKQLDPNLALQENRIQAMFGPITSVSDRYSNLGLDEFFEIDPYFVSSAGHSVPVEDVMTPSTDASLWRLVDRWNIRECISRMLSESAPQGRTLSFLVDLSDASSVDTRLSKWVGELIRHHGGDMFPGEFFLKISPKILMQDTEAVVSVCRELKQNHGFRFAIKDVGDQAMFKVCLAQFPFDMVVLSRTCTEALIPKDDRFLGDENIEMSAYLRQGRAAVDGMKLLDFAASESVASLVRGIKNAGALHAVISAGVDFVHGEFIAPEQTEVEAAIGIERVQLDDTGVWRT